MYSKIKFYDTHFDRRLVERNQIFPGYLAQAEEKRSENGHDVEADTENKS